MGPDPNRINFVEINDLGQATTIDWQYGSLNCLVYESCNSFDNSVDYTLTFSRRPDGNRLIQSKWTSAEANLNTSAAETTLYTYNASDQLLVETLYVDSTATTETTYTCTATEQTGKAVVNVASGKTMTRTSMSYDLQGRLSQIIIERLDADEQVVTRRETQGYLYNAAGSAYASGIRVQ